MKSAGGIILVWVIVGLVVPISYAVEGDAPAANIITEESVTSEVPATNSEKADVAQGEAVSAPVSSSATAQEAVLDYIKQHTDGEGNFDIYDSRIQGVRTAVFLKLYDAVGKTGDNYYSCADFRDVTTNDMLDIDFSVSDADGGLGVVDMRIHKVNDVARYVYDDQGNRIPVVFSAFPEKEIESSREGSQGVVPAPGERERVLIQKVDRETALPPAGEKGD